MTQRLRRLIGTVAQFVCIGLHKVVGRNTSRLEEGYRRMATDEAREAEAAEWSEALIGDGADETH
jgi:hypothetical protein